MRICHGMAILLSGALLGASMTSMAARGPDMPVVGMVWQPDYPTRNPQGNWEQLGVRKLLVQWSAAGDYNFVDGCNSTTPITDLPDWSRIAAEPWAQDVILGLAGDFDEPKARRSLELLVERSRCLAALMTPLRVSGWYFPVEADPTWTGVTRLGPLLNQLPRPLWISVYDNSNIGADALADWLDTWLPADVGVFFQDGVGVYARDASVAMDYLKVLQRRLGKDRVRLIAEIFRPALGGGFRAATADEMLPQLRAYTGEQVYLFEGPHYLTPPQVLEVKRAWNEAPR
ncbi:alpha-amylase family protein [Microvirgula curvata]